MLHYAAGSNPIKCTLKDNDFNGFKDIKGPAMPNRRALLGRAAVADSGSSDWFRVPDFVNNPVITQALQGIASERCIDSLNSIPASGLIPDILVRRSQLLAFFAPCVWDCLLVVYRAPSSTLAIYRLVFLSDST